MSRSRTKDERVHLRELAGRTLDAYRELNSAAAEAAYQESDKAHKESLARASELLEAVLASLKQGGARPAA